MPILLRDAPVGFIVRPPTNAYLTLNAFTIIWERRYEVARKSAEWRCVWLNSADGISRTREGIYQIRDTEYFLLPEDPRPTDGTRLEVTRSNSEERALKKQSSQARGETKYVFAFDDDEISIDTMPRQAKVVADILLASGKTEFTEKEIEEILSVPKNASELKSKQPPIAIFRFYRSEFQKLGFVRRVGGSAR